MTYCAEARVVPNIYSRGALFVPCCLFWDLNENMNRGIDYWTTPEERVVNCVSLSAVTVGTPNRLYMAKNNGKPDSHQRNYSESDVRTLYLYNSYCAQVRDVMLASDGTSAGVKAFLETLCVSKHATKWMTQHKC